jgi:alpha-glucosidase
LDYLVDLGVDVIWVCPIYASPNDDNGYDISDYKEIMADFGTMNDFDRLLQEVHRRGLKLIMDLVINHTSDEHYWFIESRSSKSNPYRDYYIWHPDKVGKEPNNWESIFGGSAWEYDEKTEEYYLHIFSRKQPDLNWENPKVRNDLYEMINWWLDKGIDGFRVDAISHIKKTPGFPDVPNPENKKFVPSFEGHMNRPGIQTFLQELKSATFNHYDIMTVGEANGVSIDDADEWVGEEKGIFNMIFQFEHLDLWGTSATGGLEINSLKQTLTKWQKALECNGWNALFLENHDQPRSVSTWGDSNKYWDKSAKCLATLYFLMQGTPFIYQGQEIGMTNVQFDSIDDYKDVAVKNLYNEERKQGKSHNEVMKVIWKTGRDNSRTPMQWDGSRYAGFTTCEPWLKVNPNYPFINVEQQQKDPSSIYQFYKKLIKLRKRFPTLIYGSYDLILKDHPSIYAYTRKFGSEVMMIVSNLFSEPTTFTLPINVKDKSLELLLCNYDHVHQVEGEMLSMKPYEARLYSIV